MTVLDQPITSDRHSYRVPSEHESLLASPPITEWGALLAENRFAISRFASTEQWVSLLQRSRTAVVESAVEHTSQYADVALNDWQQQSILMTGHQPALFHAGVWAKHFALGHAAQLQDAIGIQLIVDNDIVSDVDIAMPTLRKTNVNNGDEMEAELLRVPLDAAIEAVPYEERSIVDSETFLNADARVAAAMSPLVDDPIVIPLWKYAREAYHRMVAESNSADAKFGAVMAEARHRLERDWGLNTLELPLSRLCQTNPFREFAALILLQAAEFRGIYNDAIIGYRQRFRLRSKSHPAPGLSTDGQLTETPFWIWTVSNPHREPLYVSCSGRNWTLQAGREGIRWSIECDDSTAGLAAAMADLEIKSGVKIRPRAMITTLFARLLGSDLFVHGIGGGKYDRVTNVIAERWLGASLPEFAIVSATLHLPCARPSIEQDDLRQVDGLLRELRFHPEHSAEQVSPENALQFAQLAVDKQSLLANQPSADQAAAWHAALETANQKMFMLLSRSAEMLREERERLLKRQRADRIFSSREYSFCLFSDNGLRRTMQRLVK